jgi:DNA-binding transcriptional LysR family regulator
MLADFRKQHAEIDLEIVVSNQPVDLTRRDADVVIRVTASPPEHLVGRRVGHAGYAAYVSRPVLRRAGASSDLTAFDWLGFDDTVARFPQAKWLARAVPAARVVMRFDSLCAMLRACELGSGAAVLPCFLGDASADLARLPGTGSDDEMAVYVLTHPALRRSARIRACLQYFGDRIAAEKLRLLGRAARGRPRSERRG